MEIFNPRQLFKLHKQLMTTYKSTAWENTKEDPCVNFTI